MPRRPAGSDIRVVGLADRILVFHSSFGDLHLHPIEVAGVPDLSADEDAGQTFEIPAQRQLPQISEQQVRAARAARSDRRSGRSLVHGAVLRFVLQSDLPQAGLQMDVLAGRPLAGNWDAVL